MDRNDQTAIEDLFDRLAQVEKTAPPRDTQAEAYIGERVARQPGAPYYMAQTIVVQDQALRAAQERISALEAKGSGAGGLFGGLFGGSEPARQQATRDTGPAHERTYGRGASGGFLAGAAQTAVGVAGGLLLGNMIGGMFAGDAQAGEPEPDAGTEGADGGFEDMGDMDF